MGPRPSDVDCGFNRGNSAQTIRDPLKRGLMEPWHKFCRLLRKFCRLLRKFCRLLRKITAVCGRVSLTTAIQVGWPWAGPRVGHGTFC